MNNTNAYIKKICLEMLIKWLNLIYIVLSSSLELRVA